MKKLSLVEKLQALEELGIDTSKYDLKLELVKVDDGGIDMDKYIKDVQVNNTKLFRRFVAAQTFKMLSYEGGWGKCLHDKYSYNYQFKMLLDELKVLKKLQKEDKEEFKIRTYFFNKDVVRRTCDDYVSNFKDQMEKKMDEYGYVKLRKYGFVKLTDVVKELYYITFQMHTCEDDYEMLYSLVKLFNKKIVKLDYFTPKCSFWKDAFKGSGAYYTIKNIILFHDVTFEGMSKDESVRYLDSKLEEYKYDVWKFHYMLLDLIKKNNFDLAKSIERIRREELGE